MKNWKWLQEDSGQDLAEYAFLLLFIALACVLAMQNLGFAINATFASVKASLP